MTKKFKEELVSIDRIFLHEENPRHKPFESQTEIIEYLCKDEQVLEIARDIAQNGLSPLERLGLIEQSQKSGRKAAKTYVVGEGNRRVCALKLLDDPELAPPRLRKRFEALSDTKIDGLRSIRSVIFKDADELRHWMLLLHGGVQGGIGRKTWNAEQKSRATGSSKNRLAQEILDYAENKKFIDPAERSGKLTTVQRYLSNSNLREALGIEKNDIDELCRNRSGPDFERVLHRFIEDLKSSVVNSRSNKKIIDSYSRQLATTPGLSVDRVEPESLAKDLTGGKKSKRKKKPRKHVKRKHLEYSAELQEGLERVKSPKLLSLYYSLCKIELEDHTPLLTIGLWSFIESLSAKAGRNDTTDFTGFYSATRLAEYGLGAKRDTGVIRDALGRISKNGNTTKHHKISATFDGEQLANDMELITPLLVKTLENISNQK